MDNRPQLKGKYIIYEKIGEGGFGIVKRALNKDTGNFVAIKVIDKKLLRLHSMTAQIRREVAAFTVLKHPNIVEGYEVLSSNTKLYLVMELVSGGDLYSLLCEKKRLDPHTARKFFIDMIDAVNYCHELGIYHRDLKLENILLTSEGIVKICDFGLASVRALNTEEVLLKTICGTEDFIPPEMILHRPYSGEKADCWSAGIILYTMLAGFTPYRGRTSRDICQSIIEGKLEFPTWFPESAADLVKLLLHPDPNERITSAQVVKHPWIAAEHQASKLSNTCFSKSDKCISEFDILQNESEKSPQGVTDLEQQLNLLPRARNFPKKCSSVGDTSEREDEEAKVSSPASAVNNNNLGIYYASKTIPNFDTIYENMRNLETGFKIEDRRWRLKVYPRCFIGADAVSWISNYFNVSREEAVKIGQKFLDAEVFHHVCKDHAFKDAYLFYRFQEDEEENLHILNVRQKWKEPSSDRDAVTLSYNLLGSLLKLCKNHQAPESENLSATSIIDAQQLSQTAQFRQFAVAVAELQVVDLSTLTSDAERISFFVNCFNMLRIHSQIHQQICAAYEKRRFKGLRRLCYIISSITFSTDDIKYSILRCGSSPKSKLSMMRSSLDTKIPGCKLVERNPLVHYIILGESDSGPSIRPLEAEDVYQNIYEAAGEFLRRTVRVERESRKVLLPTFFLTNKLDFPGPERNLLEGILRVLARTKSTEDGFDPPNQQLVAELKEVLSGSLPPKVVYHSWEVTDSRLLRLRFLS